MGGGLSFGLSLAYALAESAGHHEVVLLGGEHNREVLLGTGCEFESLGNGLDNPAKRIFCEHLMLPGRLQDLGIDIFLSPDGTVPRKIKAHSVAIFQNVLYFHRDQVENSNRLTTVGRAYMYLQSKYFLSEWNRSAHRAGACVFVSDSARQEFLVRYPAMSDKSHVIYEAPAAMYSPSENIVQDAPYLLGVGTIYPYKRFDLIIELLAKLADCPELRLKIVGPDWRGQKEILTRLAGRLKVSDRIDFLGHLPAPELTQLYRGALCFCMFSDFESFGLPIVEAMACGTPVIAANRSTMIEVGGDGIVTVSTDDWSDAAEHVRRLLREPQTRQHWREQSLSRSSQFKWPDLAREYWALFEQLAGDGEHPGESAQRDAPQTDSATSGPSEKHRMVGTGTSDDFEGHNLWTT